MPPTRSRNDAHLEATGGRPAGAIATQRRSELPCPASSASHWSALGRQPSAHTPACRTRQEISMSSWRLVVTIALVGGLTGCARDTRPPVDADTARIAAADSEPGNWLTHGRTYGEQRFSPLRAIDTRTVKDLGLAWSYDLKMNRGAEATPLVVDGVMYVTSAWSIVHAIDAKTGRRLWVHDPQVSREVGPKACCD